MKKDLVIGIGVGIPVVILMIVIGGGGHSDFELEEEYEKINKTPELSPCETLTNQMIQARNSMKQYALNPNQFSPEETEKINKEYQKELNRITKEFSLQGCTENFDWVTPELTQKVIDQTGG